MNKDKHTETNPANQSNLTRDRIRNVIFEHGLTYSDMGESEVLGLQSAIESELKDFKNGKFTMRIEKKAKKDFKFNKGKLEYGFFKVSGTIEGDTPYFRNREAISFNRDGFIGFAGWADNQNVQPFLRAFEKFLEAIKQAEA